MPRDLHELSRLEDSLSYLYVERAIVERDMNSIVILRAKERIPVPVSALTVLMLGPGTNVTHEAVKVLADSGCLVIWCGEGALRFYGYGMGETRSAENLLRQARYCMDEEKHLTVVRRMFEMRFPGMDLTDKTLNQLRGMEGIRMRELYKLLAKKHGLIWKGRNYQLDDWDSSDDLNKALSAANVCLYGLCNAAIVSLGYSPGLGFIHTGKLMSFVYDVADLYKAETTIPLAFEIVTQPRANPIEREARIRLRRILREKRILKRIAGDLAALFDGGDADEPNRMDAGELWDGDESAIQGGVNYGEEP
ncbi:MAG: type I-E CRISPR-associated endonuclease Cas1e [bacterium]